MNPEELRTWLREQKSIDVSAVTCKTWLGKDWSSDGQLRSVFDVEEQIGELLRSAAYRDSFDDDASAAILAEQLSEGQPPVCTTSSLLRQWYQKFHPGAGSKSIATAAELEAFMGDDLRCKYHGLGYKVLRTVLSQRRCPVLISTKWCGYWSKSIVARSSRGRRRPYQSLARGLPPQCMNAAALPGSGNAKKYCLSLPLVPL